jgi:hypothetical protein
MPHSCPDSEWEGRKTAEKRRRGTSFPGNVIYFCIMPPLKQTPSCGGGNTPPSHRMDDNRIGMNALLVLNYTFTAHGV